MEPKDVHYVTDLEGKFVEDLKKVKDGESFESFLGRWRYWLDDGVKDMKADDWEWMKPLLADCRKDGVEPEEKHEPAMALMMPERILRVSITAHEFKVPWGCAYIRLKEMGQITW